MNFESETIENENKFIDDKLMEEIQDLVIAQPEKDGVYEENIINFLQKHPESTVELCLQIADRQMQGVSKEEINKMLMTTLVMKLSFIMKKMVKKLNDK